MFQNDVQFADNKFKNRNYLKKANRETHFTIVKDSSNIKTNFIPGFSRYFMLNYTL